MDDKKKLKITLVKSPIGFNEKQARVVESMGLREIRHSVELTDTPEVRGMIHKVRHLVEVASNASLCGFGRCRLSPASLSECMDLSNLKPARAPNRRASASDVGPGRATARRPAAATRVRSRDRGIRTSAGSKAARCRCIAVCRSAGSTTPTSAPNTRSSISTSSRPRSTAGRPIDRAALREAGTGARRQRRIKVLGRGEVTKALTVQAHKFSGKAAEKLAAAGGKAEAIG